MWIEVLPQLLHCLNILLPLSFLSCCSIKSSPSILMWIHSKFNYASELLSTFSDPGFQQGGSVGIDYRWIALCCMLSIAFV